MAFRADTPDTLSTHHPPLAWISKSHEAIYRLTPSEASTCYSGSMVSPSFADALPSCSRPGSRSLPSESCLLQGAPVALGQATRLVETGIAQPSCKTYWSRPDALTCTV